MSLSSFGLGVHFWSVVSEGRNSLFTITVPLHRWPTVDCCFWSGKHSADEASWNALSDWLISLQIADFNHSVLFLFSFQVFCFFPVLTTQAENSTKQNRCSFLSDMFSLCTPSIYITFGKTDCFWLLVVFVACVSFFFMFWSSGFCVLIRICLVIFLSHRRRTCVHVEHQLQSLPCVKDKWGNVRQCEAFDHLAFVAVSSLRLVWYVRITTTLWNSEYRNQ